MRRASAFQFLHGPSQLTPERREKQQALFKKLFGEEAIHFDPAAVERVKVAQPGEPLTLDTNGDGKVDTVYFIDTDPKHQAPFRPILVKVIDRDGDLDRDGDGDRDSDLWIADWNANGSVDAVVSYRDMDSDNDLDEMGIYTYSLNDRFMQRDVMRVWWSRDIGDDNLLWDTINYRYQQAENQFRTHFGGDEIFSSFAYDDEQNKWIPSFENPFVFYDDDHDGETETVIRFSGRGGQMETLRYSMDADNDSTAENPHDFDFSFSCVSRGPASPVAVPPALTEAIQLEDIPAAPILSWKHARPFAQTAPWGKVLLTWDENDNNVDGAPNADPHERWEGILNSATEHFPQVGGPPCGPYNKRYETDLDNSGGMKLYYLPADRRLHLLGMDEGWIKVDYNYDGKVDMEFRYSDSDSDGVIDTIAVDIDGNQKIDRSFHIANPHAVMLPLDHRALSNFYNSKLDAALTENQIMIDAMKEVLKKAETNFQEDEVERYFREDLPNYRREARIGEKIVRSREGIRYYQDLVRERYCLRLSRLLRDDPALLRSLDEYHNTGNYSRAAALLRERKPKMFESKRGDWYGDFTRRITMDIANPDAKYRLNEPVVLKAADIRKIAPDFNPSNVTVVAANRQLAWKEIASQADDLDGDGKFDELVFELDLAPRQTLRYSIYYSPHGASKRSYEKRTAASLDWLGLDANIGWESERIGYRFYYGQMDFFGKKKDQLVMSGFGKSENYHHEQDWGMDVLLVGKTPGIGGISVWENGEPYPAFRVGTPGDLRLQRRIIAEGPVRSTVLARIAGVRAGNDTYEVDQLFSIYVGGRYSQNRIVVRPQKQAKEVFFGPGFTKLPHDTAFYDPARGYFGSWGRQNSEIQEIGLGAIFPPNAFAGFSESSNERQIRFHVRPGQELTYYIIGDWRKGRTFPVAPSARNWEKEIEALAARLQRPVDPRIVAVESKTAAR